MQIIITQNNSFFYKYRKKNKKERYIHVIFFTDPADINVQITA